MVGGAWPGLHQEGKTYARFSVDVTDGTIGLHSGLWAAEVRSGLNGIQLISPDETVVATGKAPPVRLTVVPNPARSAQRIRVPAGGRVEIFDATGRLVWGRRATRADELVWDGRDRTGLRVPAAVYLVRLRGSEGTVASTKLVRLDWGGRPPCLPIRPRAGSRTGEARPPPACSR